MNVLLVGEESAGIQTLKALARSDHRIVAVMASPAKKSLSSSTLWQVAENIGLPTWPASLVKDPAFAGRIFCNPARAWITEFESEKQQI